MAEPATSAARWRAAARAGAALLLAGISTVGLAQPTDPLEFSCRVLPAS